MKGAFIFICTFILVLPILVAQELPIIPTFNCIKEQNHKTYAVFGFENQNSFAVTIPVGENNSISPPPINKGQPTKLEPGTFSSFFDVFYDITLPEWKLVGPDKVERKAVASIDKRCQSFCGDNIIDQGEECDDGNQEHGDGCSANCQIEYALPEFSSVTISLAFSVGLVGYIIFRKRR